MNALLIGLGFMVVWFIGFVTGHVLGRMDRVTTIQPELRKSAAKKLSDYAPGDR